MGILLQNTKLPWKETRRKQKFVSVALGYTHTAWSGIKQPVELSEWQNLQFLLWPLGAVFTKLITRFCTITLYYKYNSCLAAVFLCITSVSDLNEPVAAFLMQPTSSQVQICQLAEALVCTPGCSPLEFWNLCLRSCVEDTRVRLCYYCFNALSVQKLNDLQIMQREVL